MSIKNWPESEKMQEKLFATGFSALSDAELQAALLATGYKGQTAKAQGRELLKVFGSLTEVMRPKARF